MAETVDQPSGRPTNKMIALAVTTLIVNVLVRAAERFEIVPWLAADSDGLRELASLIVGGLVAYRFFRDRPNEAGAGGAPLEHSTDARAPWWSVLGAAGLALLLMGGGLAGCANDPATGAPRTLGERIAIGAEYFFAAAEIADAVTGGPEDAGPSVLDRVLAEIDQGIGVYCTLPPASQDLMIADVDPAILALAKRHRGGTDGDVCTEDHPGGAAPPDI